jgi:hypothetical protein
MDVVGVAFNEGYSLAMKHCLAIVRKTDRGESANNRIRKANVEKEKCLKELKKKLKK